MKLELGKEYSKESVSNFMCSLNGQKINKFGHTVTYQWFYISDDYAFRTKDNTKELSKDTPFILTKTPEGSIEVSTKDAPMMLVSDRAKSPKYWQRGKSSGEKFNPVTQTINPIAAQ